MDRLGLRDDIPPGQGRVSTISRLGQLTTPHLGDRRVCGDVGRGAVHEGGQGGDPWCYQVWECLLASMELGIKSVSWVIVKNELSGDGEYKDPADWIGGVVR